MKEFTFNFAFHVSTLSSGNLGMCEALSQSTVTKVVDLRHTLCLLFCLTLNKSCELFQPLLIK